MILTDIVVKAFYFCYNKAENSSGMDNILIFTRERILDEAYYLPNKKRLLGAN
jgi:hypothetical protein